MKPLQNRIEFEQMIFQAGFEFDKRAIDNRERYTLTRKVFRELGGEGGLIHMHEETKPNFSTYYALERTTGNYFKAFVSSLLQDLAMWIMTKLSPRLGLILSSKTMHSKLLKPKFVSNKVEWSENHKIQVYIVVDGKDYPDRKRLVMLNLKSFDEFTKCYNRGSSSVYYPQSPYQQKGEDFNV